MAQNTIPPQLTEFHRPTVEGTADQLSLWDAAQALDLAQRELDDMEGRLDRFDMRSVEYPHWRDLQAICGDLWRLRRRLDALGAPILARAGGALAEEVNEETTRAAARQDAV